jgi:tetratricopeptide (TPR) repeat protein
LAHFLVDQDRPQEALEFTAGHESDSLEVLTAHGRALVDAARYEEAVMAFSQAIQQSDSPASWLYANKWYAERECGCFDEALSTAQRGQALFPDDPRWYMRLAGSLRALDRFDEADQTIEAGKAHGLTEADVFKATYETAWAKKDFVAALAAVDGLLASGEDEPLEHRLTWWEEKHLRLLVELDRFDDARRFAGSKDLDAEGWGEAAWAIARAEEDALCLEFAERALALDPENYAGLYNRAQSLSDLDREEESIAAFHRLRAAHPNEHNAYEKLALRLAVDGKVDEALQLADRAVELGSFCTYAWATRGYVYFVRGQRPEALADLEAAWNRADVDERRRSYDYWWLLVALQEDADQSARYKQLAIAEAKTALDRQIIAQVERLLQ